MSPKRLTLGLASLLLGLLTGLTAYGQEGVRELPGMQLFDDADIRPYGDWEAPGEGFFVSFDGLWWTISAPKKTTIGLNAPGLLTGSNTLDTGALRAKQKEGNLIDFGYTDEHHGFLFESWELDGQTQHIYAQNANITFGDPDHLFSQNDTVTVPFATVSVVNRTQTDGLELLYTYRMHPLEQGGQFTWMAGARYVRFDDQFNITTQLINSPLLTNPPESICYTTDQNRIWGPEVGVRWLKEFGRWGVSAEGRGMIGVNDQAIKQYGGFDSTLGGSGFNSSAHVTTMAPLVEFRIEGHVQITRLIALKAGWRRKFHGRHRSGGRPGPIPNPQHGTPRRTLPSSGLHARLERRPGNESITAGGLGT